MARSSQATCQSCLDGAAVGQRGGAPLDGAPVDADLAHPAQVERHAGIAGKSPQDAASRGEEPRACAVADGREAGAHADAP